MAIEGRLRELALADVFQLLELSRKTGVLSVHNDAHGRSSVVRFEEGAVCGAEAPEEQGRLGHRLVRSGKLSELDMERVLREKRLKPTVPFGTLAIELGVVTPAEVQKHLVHQVQETVFELFRWKDGFFRFEEAPLDAEGAVRVRIATQSLLMEAARRVDEWAVLASRIPHTGVVPVLAKVDLPDSAPLDLSPAEWEVLAEVDGQRPLKQIADELGRSDLEVAKAVCRLIGSQVVELDDAPQLGTGNVAQAGLIRTAGEIERALRERRLADAERLLEGLPAQYPDQADVFLLQGRVLSASGRWHDAIESFSGAVKLDPLAAQAYLHLGFAAARTGNFPCAAHAWNTFLRLPEGRGPRGSLVRRALQAVAALRVILDAETA
jgi:cytochrome c-type biogenesis protein CcmH/NrfG